MISQYKQSKCDYNLAHVFLAYKRGEVHIVNVQFFSSHIKSFMVFIIIEYYIQMIFCVNYIFLVVYLLKQSKYDFNLAPMFLQYNIDEVHILIVQLVFCILNHIWFLTE